MSASILSAVRSYGVYLEKSPFRANMITGGILWGIGDALCQRLAPPINIPPKITNDKFISIYDQKPAFDYKRLAAMSVFGFFGAGPAYAAWYKALDVSLAKIFYRTDKMRSSAASGRWNTPWHQKWKMTMAKVVSDFVLFDPVFLCVFFTATQLLEGHTVQDGIRKLKVDLLGTYWMDVKVWTPIQLVNFRYVPVTFQPVVVNIGNVGWNAYLSFVQHKQDISEETEK